MNSKKKPLIVQIDNLCTIVHNPIQYSVLKTEEFVEWYEALPPKTYDTIEGRFDRVARGHLGDHKRFDGLIELRWKNGTRIYCFIWSQAFIVMLIGGNKNGQDRDIREAKKIQQEILNGVRSLF